MANKSASLYLNIRKPDGRWTFARPKTSNNGRLKPLVAVVDGREEKHPEAKYYLFWYRKETFVDILYPNFNTFAELTRQEEDLGLLSHPEIGFQQQWRRLLSERHLRIVGHKVFGNDVSEPSRDEEAGSD